MYNLPFVSFLLKLNVNTVVPDQSMLVLYPAVHSHQFVHDFILLSVPIVPDLKHLCLQNCNCKYFPMTLNSQFK